MSQYGVFSGPYFPVFGLNTGKYEPEKAPNLDLFHIVANVPSSASSENMVKIGI